MAACLMAEGPTTLHGVPRLERHRPRCSSSSRNSAVGSSVATLPAWRNTGNSTSPDASLNGPLDIEVIDDTAVEAPTRSSRRCGPASACSGRCWPSAGGVVLRIPGGCAIGDRPVDLHLRGLEKLGAEFRTRRRQHRRRGPGGRLQGLPALPRRGAAADGAGDDQRHVRRRAGRGTKRVIVGAACEPEVADCARLLNAWARRISGARHAEMRHRRRRDADRLRAHASFPTASRPARSWSPRRSPAGNSPSATATSTT